MMWLHIQELNARRRGWRGWLPSWGGPTSQSGNLKLSGSQGSRAVSKSRSRDLGAAAGAAVAAVDGAPAEPIDAVGDCSDQRSHAAVPVLRILLAEMSRIHICKLGLHICCACGSIDHCLSLWNSKAELKSITQ